MRKISMIVLGLTLFSSAFATHSFEKGILKFTVLQPNSEITQADSVVKVSSIDRLTALPASLFDKVLTIPGYVEHNGCKYQVRKVDSEAFVRCDFIEDIIIEEGVEEIGEAAFASCYDIKSLHLPSTVKYIDVSSFQKCVKLKEITVAKENRFFDSRNNCNAIINTTDNELFLGCQTSVIPNSVTSIGELAFNGCVYLTNIVIPDGIKEIKSYAFFDCVRLNQVELPSTLTYLGEGVFAGCENLRSVTLPSSLNQVAKDAFEGAPINSAIGRMLETL